MRRNETRQSADDNGVLAPVNERGRCWRTVVLPGGVFMYDPDEVSAERAAELIRELEATS